MNANFKRSSSRGTDFARFSKFFLLNLLVEVVDARFTITKFVDILVIENHIVGCILNKLIHGAHVLDMVAPREINYVVIVSKLDIELISFGVLNQFNSKCRAKID